jgi:DNA repair photolyase
MRWRELQVSEEVTRQLPGYRDPAAVRTFDAPEAMDIRFYEVRAKSALNRVPSASRMPFRWTVNPYRGCTHACTYCLAGETPVLMADRELKPLAEVAVGDRVYGTELRRGTRRYAVAEVLDHWTTLKPAHRVTLDDGTRLVASADHRLLTRRGFKQVSGTEPGGPRRRLSASDQLLGPGALGAGSRGRGALAGGEVGSERGLWVNAIEPLREELVLHDVTTTTGDFVASGVVSHNCFARPTHRYLDLSPGRDFEREIVVKVNAPEALRAQLSRPSWRREHVALGTNTDPYQWVEGRYRLMPGIWEALRDADTPCSVLTKSPLLLRDLPLLRELAERVGFTAALSVPTLDEPTWRATEPHTPHPRARLEAVAELNRAGVPTSVLIAPLMPGINDSPAQVERILSLAADAGATGAGGICLHLRGEVREVFFDWLRAQRPDLVGRYERLYARGAYAPRAERERIGRMVRELSPEWPRRGAEWPARPRSRSSPRDARAGASDAPPRGAAGREAEQQRLF